MVLRGLGRYLSTLREHHFSLLLRRIQCLAVVPLSMQHTGLEVCHSQDGRHLPDHVPDECDIVFVLEEFSGPVFDQLRSTGLR